MQNVLKANIKQTYHDIEQCENCGSQIEDEYRGLVYDRITHYQVKAICSECEDLYREHGLIS